MNKVSWLGIALVGIGILVALVTQQVYPDVCTIIGGPSQSGFVFQGIDGFDVQYSLDAGKNSCTQVNGVFIVIGIIVALFGTLTFAVENVRQQIGS